LKFWRRFGNCWRDVSNQSPAKVSVPNLFARPIGTNVSHERLRSVEEEVNGIGQQEKIIELSIPIKNVRYDEPRAETRRRGVASDVLPPFVCNQIYCATERMQPRMVSKIVQNVKKTIHQEISSVESPLREIAPERHRVRHVQGRGVTAHFPNLFPCLKKLTPDGFVTREASQGHEFSIRLASVEVRA
jgi:hypothetical protein